MSIITPATATITPTVLPDIYQTYSNKHVFITGGSGFLGKVLIYKILKEFPDVASVTVLMRGKKGKKPHDRLEGEVLASLCFDGLKQELGPQEWKRRTSKLRVAVGDVMNDSLGLNQEDMKFLCENCNIILHLAATVNFQEKLPISVQMNTLGGLRVLSIAKKCTKLEAMIHTSTCYVNYSRHGTPVVKETIHPLPFDPEQMCRLILGMSEHDVPRQTAILLKKYGFPNTYTFTKNMGELLIQRMKGPVPVTIVRPAIIGCSLREPYPGWVDALTAASSMILTVGIGMTHEVTANANNIADIVPVDYVVNMILKAAYKTSVQHKYGTIRIPPVLEINSTHQQQSTLLEKNLHRVDTKSGSATIPSASSIPDNIRISSYADSNSGDMAIRPPSKSNSSKQSGGGNAPRKSSTSIPLKQVLGGSETASTGSSSSDENVSASNHGTNSTPLRLPFIFHSSTSCALIPLTWDATQTTVCNYFSQHPAPRTIDKPFITMYPNEKMFEIVFFLKRKLPFYAMNVASKIPGVMNSKQKALVAKYAKMLFRVSDLNFQFKPFVTIEWRFDYKNAGKYLDDGMAPNALKAFGTDLYDIDWTFYIEAYCYGLVRYFMKVKDSRPIPSAPGSSSDKFMRSML